MRIALVVTLRNESVMMSGYAFNCASKQSSPRENGSVYRHRLHLIIGMKFFSLISSIIEIFSNMKLCAFLIPSFAKYVKNSFVIDRLLASEFVS